MEESDDGMDVQPKPKPKPKLKQKAGMPIRPRPIPKTSQRQAKVPNVADQRDLTTDKGSSAQKSNLIRKSLFFFFGCDW